MSEASENPYLRDAVMTASPEQLHLMLYDGCIRYAGQARVALENKDYEASFDRLTRARNIISEMQSGLRYEVNPELCERVGSIYGFLYSKLLDANVNRCIQDVDDAIRVLKIERETWQILVDKVNRIAPGGDKPTLNPDGAARVPFSAEG